MTKNTTAAGRGAMLAKESLALRKSPPILLADMEKGNRLDILAGMNADDSYGAKQGQAHV